MTDLWNKIRAIVDGWVNSWRNKRRLLSPSEAALFNARLEICKSNECGKLKWGVCTACGCPVSKKTMSPTETCPENMWNPQVYEYLGINFIMMDDVPEPTREELSHWLAVNGARDRLDIPGLSWNQILDAKLWEKFLERGLGNVK